MFYWLVAPLMLTLYHALSLSCFQIYNGILSVSHLNISHSPSHFWRALIDRKQQSKMGFVFARIYENYDFLLSV